MADVAAADASPLILLGRAGMLELLQVAASSVVVPDVVAREVEAPGPDDLAARALAGAAWLSVVPTPAEPAALAAWKLGAGEAAVISYALANPGAVAILDDRAGRRCAAALGVPVTGTLGVVLIAKRRGLVASARATLTELRAAGLYLDAGVEQRALALIGE